MKLKNIFILCCCLLMIWNAVFSLWGKKYIPTHDGEYHIIRIVEFSKMLGSGYLFPRWAPDLNSGFGIPIFQYHYPLPNYVGAAVRFFTQDAVYAFQYSLALAYVTIVLGLFYWLTSFFPVSIALLGSIIASYSPYIFLDLYVRGVVGELWAIGFFGFTLGSIERKKYIQATIFFALLILSHNISAMIFGLYLGMYTLYRKRNLGFLIGGTLLSSYFWIPALFEQKFVIGLNTVNFRDHFVQLYEFLIPSWGSQFSSTGNIGSKMSFQIGIIPLFLSGIVIIRSRYERDYRFKSLLVFLAGSLSVLILLFPVSSPVWELIIPLQFVQYPWRLLSMVIPVSAFGASYVLYKRKSFMMMIVLVLCTLAITWKYVRPVLYEPRNEVYYTSRSNFTDGTSSMGNSFTTIWSSWKEVRPVDQFSVTNGNVSGRIQTRYLQKTVSVDMIKPGILQFNTLYFPGWKAVVNGKNTEILYINNGTIQLELPKGVHTVSIRYGETSLRFFADVLSIASLIGIALWGILSVRKTRT